MKLALILMISFGAFVALHAQIIPSEVIDLKPELGGPDIDGIKDIMENAVQYINEYIDKIESKIKVIIDKAKESSGNAVGYALEKLWDIVRRIAEIAKTGIAAKQCAKPYENRIAEIIEEVKTAIKTCGAESLKELEHAVKETIDLVDEIKRYADELYDMMVRECFDSDGNILGGPWCVAKQVFIIRDKVKAAVELAEEAILGVKEKTIVIIENHKECIVITAEKSLTELWYIYFNIRGCMDNNDNY